MPCAQVEDLLSAIEERQPGEVITLTVHRGASPRRVEQLQVRLVSRDELAKPRSFFG